MTRAPYVMLKPGRAWDRTPPAVADSTVGWRFTNPRFPADWTISLGQTAERVAKSHGISRREQEEFAVESQRRAQAAIAAGVFDDEIVPAEVQRDGRSDVISRDEPPRGDVTLESLAKLSPAFQRDGTVTAGTSSGINDGASVLAVASESAAKEMGARPLARVISTAVAGVDPSCMGLGPVPATRKALARAGLRGDELDLIEMNEAFAAQAIACVRDLELDPAKVNLYGGAIALGHPLGASGARILTTLVHALRRTGGRYGLATMCIGVGQGIAMVVEAGLAKHLGQHPALGPARCRQPQQRGQRWGDIRHRRRGLPDSGHDPAPEPQDRHLLVVCPRRAVPVPVGSSSTRM